jgi:hypothetical protein
VVAAFLALYFYCKHRIADSSPRAALGPHAHEICTTMIDPGGGVSNTWPKTLKSSKHSSGSY